MSDRQFTGKRSFSSSSSSSGSGSGSQDSLPDLVLDLTDSDDGSAGGGGAAARQRVDRHGDARDRRNREVQARQAEMIRNHPTLLRSLDCDTFQTMVRSSEPLRNLLIAERLNYGGSGPMDRHRRACLFRARVGAAKRFVEHLNSELRRQTAANTRNPPSVVELERQALTMQRALGLRRQHDLYAYTVTCAGPSPAVHFQAAHNLGNILLTHAVDLRIVDEYDILSGHVLYQIARLLAPNLPANDGFDVAEPWAGTGRYVHRGTWPGFVGDESDVVSHFDLPMHRSNPFAPVRFLELATRLLNLFPPAALDPVQRQELVDLIELVQVDPDEWSRDLSVQVRERVNNMRIRPPRTRREMTFIERAATDWLHLAHETYHVWPVHIDQWVFGRHRQPHINSVQHRGEGYHGFLSDTDVLVRDDEKLEVWDASSSATAAAASRGEGGGGGGGGGAARPRRRQFVVSDDDDDEDEEEGDGLLW